MRLGGWGCGRPDSAVCRVNSRTGSVRASAPAVWRSLGPPSVLECGVFGRCPPCVHPANLKNTSDELGDGHERATTSAALSPGGAGKHCACSFILPLPLFSSFSSSLSLSLSLSVFPPHLPFPFSPPFLSLLPPSPFSPLPFLSRLPLPFPSSFSFPPLPHLSLFSPPCPLFFLSLSLSPPRALSSCNGNPLVDGRLTVRLMRRVDWTC
jgi:hypothetical protein